MAKKVKATKKQPTWGSRYRDAGLELMRLQATTPDDLVKYALTQAACKYFKDAREHEIIELRASNVGVSP